MGSVFVASSLAVVVVLAIRSIYKDKKAGKGCNGNCGSCKGCH